MPLKVARNRNIFIPNENAGNSSNCSFTCLKGTVISSTHTSHVLPVKNSSKAPNAGSQAFAPRRDVGQPLGRASRPQLRRAGAGTPQASPVRAQPRPAAPPAGDAPVLLSTEGRIGPPAAQNQIASARDRPPTSVHETHRYVHVQSRCMLAPAPRATCLSVCQGLRCQFTWKPICL